MSTLLLRLHFEYLYKKHKEVAKDDKIRTLVIVAGNGRSVFVRSLKKIPYSLSVIGVLDDDINKQGSLLFGIPILRKIKDIPIIVKEKNVDQITIDSPPLTLDVCELIVEISSEIGLTCNMMPYIEDVLQGKLGINQFLDINVVDLLGRDEVKLDMEQVSSSLRGATMLVSGSIRSEISRQISRFLSKKIVLLGRGENSIYQIDRELKNTYKGEIGIILVIADLQYRKKIF